MIQKTTSPLDNWHPLCYSPRRSTSQNGVRSVEERYSQSDMQIKHYLCCVNKTSQKLQSELCLQHMEAERMQASGLGAPNANPRGLGAPCPAAVPGKVPIEPSSFHFVLHSISLLINPKGTEHYLHACIFPKARSASCSPPNILTKSSPRNTGGPRNNPEALPTPSDLSHPCPPCGSWRLGAECSIQEKQQQGGQTHLHTPWLQSLCQA